MVRGIREHMKQPHELVCFTDDPAGLECDAAPIWESPREIPRHLNCLRRVKLCDMRLADRMVSMDIDGIVTGPLDPLVDRDESFVIWGYPIKAKIPYCGSMWMVRQGEHNNVWGDLLGPEFHEVKDWKHGSDQVWFARKIRGAGLWGTGDGMYSYRNHCKNSLKRNARVVWFHGEPKPWGVQSGWVKERM